MTTPGKASSRKPRGDVRRRLAPLPGPRVSRVSRSATAGPGDRRPSYVELSLHPAVSVLACLPLFAAYELGLLLLASGERNAAEWALFHVFDLAGPGGTLGLRLLLGLCVVLSLAVVIRDRIPCVRVAGLVALEGCAYGVLLGPASLWLSHPLAAGAGTGPGALTGLAADLVASVGPSTRSWCSASVSSRASP